MAGKATNMAPLSLAVFLIYLAGCVVKADAGKLGAVASESELCSRYGADMLEKGGTAADAVSSYCFDWSQDSGD